MIRCTEANDGQNDFFTNLEMQYEMQIVVTPLLIALLIV